MTNLELWQKLGRRVLKNSIPEPNSGCWIWTGYLHSNGYATLKWDRGRSSTMAHRASYQAFRGEIPDGLVIDHKCKVRCCVNPDHLEPVTYKENNKRSPRSIKLKTHCIKGHPLSGDNEVYYGGQRSCRICRANSSLSSYYRRKAK